MKVRFQADSDLHQTIVDVTIRREPGIDFRAANSAGLAGLHDLIVLRRAAADGRVLVTHDQSTMPAYFAEFIATRSTP